MLSFVSTASTSISAIFDYVISTRQLNSPWLSILVVTHLRTINFTAYPGGVNTALFKMLINRCKVKVFEVLKICYSRA